MTRSKVRVEFNIRLAQDIAQDAAVRGVRFATLEGLNLTRHVLGTEGGPRTGKVITWNGKPHQQSAPGEPPAPKTSNLKIKTNEEVFGGPNPRGEVIANAEYAAALELGTEKMKPRPFLSRVINEYSDRLRAVFITGARGA